MNRTILIFTIVTLFFQACQSDQQAAETSRTQVTNPPQPDTLVQKYPERIGDDMVTIEVYSMPPVTASEAGRHFKIRLVRKGTQELFIDVTPYVLFKLNQTVLFKNAAEADFTDGAMIKEIVYKNVRANTLYFSAVLENPAENKTIKGRFNLFHSTDRKGEIYGWITDEVN